MSRVTDSKQERTVILKAQLGETDRKRITMTEKSRESQGIVNVKSAQ